MKRYSIIILFSCALAACSDDTDDKKQLTGDHVWKAQTEALEKAKEVQGLASDMLDEQKKKMEELNN